MPTPGKASNLHIFLYLQFFFYPIVLPSLLLTSPPRAHKLYTPKSLLCDPRLQAIFQVPGLRLSSLWPRLEALMEPVLPAPLLLVLSLEDQASSSSCSTPVRLNSHGELLPSDFPPGEPDQPGGLQRTRSLASLPPHTVQPRRLRRLTSSPRLSSIPDLSSDGDSRDSSDGTVPSLRTATWDQSYLPKQ